MYIIIKTSKNMISELISIHKTKEDASYKLMQQIDKKYVNKVMSNNILKVYENNLLMHNGTIHLYQIINIDEQKKKEN